MLQERDFIRLRKPQVGEWTQPRTTPIPAGADLVDDVTALVGGTVRPDIPDPAPVPVDEQPLPDLVYADAGPGDQQSVQAGGPTETAPVAAPSAPLPRRSPETSKES